MATRCARSHCLQLASRRLGVRAGGDPPDGEPGMALENLGNPLDLVLQSPALASSEPDERLDGHFNLAARSDAGARRQ